MSGDKEGKIKHAGGKIQEKAGEFLGDKKMKREGRLRQVEGEAEQDIHRAAEKVEDAAARRAAAKEARDKS